MATRARFPFRESLALRSCRIILADATAHGLGGFRVGAAGSRRLGGRWLWQTNRKPIQDEPEMVDLQRQTAGLGNDNGAGNACSGLAAGLPVDCSVWATRLIRVTTPPKVITLTAGRVSDNWAAPRLVLRAPSRTVQRFAAVARQVLRSPPCPSLPASTSRRLGSNAPMYLSNWSSVPATCRGS